MKVTLLISMLLISVAVFAQDTLTYAMTQDLEYTKGKKNGIDYKVYVAKDGSIIKWGDTLKIAEPDGAGAAVRTVVGMRAVKEFRFVYMEHYPVGAALSVPTRLNTNHKHELVTVTRIRVAHARGNKNSVLLPVFYAINPNTSKGLGNGQKRTIYDYEMAVATGEVVNPNRAMTRTEAIAKLREAKELLDLGVMIQEDYERLKAKLTLIINKD